MATTTFSGPVVSQNGFVSDSLVIGTTTITAGVATGTVSTQIGYIPVNINGTVAYIALYSSLTP